MRTQILYEDKEIIVIYKPAGLATQSARVAQPDAVSELNTYLTAKNGGKPAYLGLIHRLDQPVEGLLVFAKTKNSAAYLSTQFSERAKTAEENGADHKKRLTGRVGRAERNHGANGACEKVYYAIAHVENGDRGLSGKETLTDYMMKDSRTNLAKIVKKGTSGAKKAVLVYEVLEQKEDLALLRVQLLTGRFHQIRTQLAHAGLPLLGDRKYGTDETAKRSEERSVKTVALCAAELTFIHPGTGKEMHFRQEPQNECFRFFKYFGAINNMARPIMIQGTMSNAGKSLVAAGICRVLKQDGYRVCPFKSQNMALNSFITKEGLEMGRAQVMQAQACGIEPSVRMNPILLKPNSDTGSQVIVNGEVIGNRTAKDYFAEKKRLIPEVLKAYKSLADEYDVIVIEGAGSPAEINLKENDIVNMGMAQLADAPVLLVGDIDRGGVFAQLYGTVKLLEQEEQERIRGLIVNKFRGDVSILEPGLERIEELTGIPVVGVLPFIRLDLEDEDSLSGRLLAKNADALLDLAVIRFPRLSNFTDFDVFGQFDEVSVRFVSAAAELGSPDLIFLPGTKSTIDDLLWMRKNGLEASINRLVEKGTPLFGICGGYQMLGMQIADEAGVEGAKTVRGMGLLPVRTVFGKQKYRRQTPGMFSKIGGVFSELSGKRFAGYELHHGRTEYSEGAVHLTEPESLCRYENDTTDAAVTARVDGVLQKKDPEEKTVGMQDGAWRGNVYGTYVHGIFDEKDVAETIIRVLLKQKGYEPGQLRAKDRRDYREEQFDRLADMIRQNMDMQALYRIMGLEKHAQEEPV